jgi:TRAP transporter T-component
MMHIKRLTGGTALLVSFLIAAGQNRAFANLPNATGREAYFAGKRAPTSDERRAAFSAGIRAARERLARSPDDPEGLLWLAANLGAEALERGKLSALNVLPEMERLLLRLDAVAPSYDHAAAARTLGRLYHKAPAIISIGSKKKARQYWEKALAAAPDYPANLVLAADFFADAGDKTRARELAARYRQRPVTPEENPEATEWNEIAARVLGED